MNDEAVAEVVEEEVTNEIDSVDAEEVEDVTESETGESEETGEAEENAEPSESSAEKKDDGFQKRIDELTRRYYTEKQQREHYQKQWEDSQTVEPEPAGKTLADFEYDEGKFAEYLQGQAVAAAKAEIEQANQRQAHIQRRAAFEAKEQSFATNVPDYHTVTRNQALPITQQMVEALQSAEKGPEVLYYLGKNPDVAASLANMNPLDAAREIGRIEVTKLKKSEPSPPKAPEKTPKIKAASTGGVRINPDDPKGDELSDEEWLKRRNKQLASRK